MIPEARENPDIIAISQADFADRKVYQVEGEDGHWRRITRKGGPRLQPQTDHGKMVHVEEHIYEVVPWDIANTEQKPACEDTAPEKEPTPEAPVDPPYEETVTEASGPSVMGVTPPF